MALIKSESLLAIIFKNLRLITRTLPCHYSPAELLGVWLRADPAIYGDDEVDKIPHPSFPLWLLPFGYEGVSLGLKYRLHMLWLLITTHDGAKRIRKLWSFGKFTN